MKKALIIGTIIVVIIAGIGVALWMSGSLAKLPFAPATQPSPTDQLPTSNTESLPNSQTPDQSIELITSQQSIDEGVLSMNRTSTFRPNETIHVTAFLPSDRLNTSVVLDFVYNVDKSQLGPMAKNPRQVGDKVAATYALTPPPAGWPVGEYSVTFIASPTEITSQTITIQ
jgi:hypothetical protein